MKRYDDCSKDGNCLGCALSSHRRDCKNNPANNLAYHRVLTGLRQSDLAEKIGVSVRTIQDYEQGRRDINAASALTVYKMARILNTDMENLLELENEEVVENEEI